VITVVEAAEQGTAPPEPPTLGALQSANDEISPSLGGTPSNADNGTAATQQKLTPASQGINSLTQASTVIRIIFRLP
jgi:hypothetical protein